MATGVVTGGAGAAVGGATDFLGKGADYLPAGEFSRHSPEILKYTDHVRCW
jgi:hypothetical protein